MGKPRAKPLDHRVRLALLGVVVVAVLASGGWLVSAHLNSGSRTKQADTGLVLPTPSAARSTFTNPVYGYTIRYPTDWTLIASDDKSRVQVFIVQDKAVPQGMAFDIWCDPNPSGMSAQQWRQSEIPPNLDETVVGYVTLSSGVQAYKVTGHATNLYDVFTSVHAGKACDLSEYETDAANAKIIEASINSFAWN